MVLTKKKKKSNIHESLESTPQDRNPHKQKRQHDSEPAPSPETALVPIVILVIPTQSTKVKATYINQFCNN